MHTTGIEGILWIAAFGLLEVSEASNDADSFGVKATRAANASNLVISSARANRTYNAVFPSMLAACTPPKQQSTWEADYISS